MGEFAGEANLLNMADAQEQAKARAQEIANRLAAKIGMAPADGASCKFRISPAPHGSSGTHCIFLCAPPTSACHFLPADAACAVV
jgi:hypothetical protein